MDQTLLIDNVDRADAPEVFARAATWYAKKYVNTVNPWARDACARRLLLAATAKIGDSMFDDLIAAMATIERTAADNDEAMAYAYEALAIAADTLSEKAAQYQRNHEARL